jgi:hypothetical protein
LLWYEILVALEVFCVGIIRERQASDICELVNAVKNDEINIVSVGSEMCIVYCYIKDMVELAQGYFTHVFFPSGGPIISLSGPVVV